MLKRMFSIVALAALFLVVFPLAMADENVPFITVTLPDGTQQIAKNSIYRITQGGEYTFMQNNTAEQLTFCIEVKKPDTPVTINLAGLNIKANESDNALSISGTQPVCILLVENTVNRLMGNGRSGIDVGKTANVTIDGKGILYATGTSCVVGEGYNRRSISGAGIHKGPDDNTLTISGGTVYAEGGAKCAGIGGNYSSSGGSFGGTPTDHPGAASNIIITGGTIYAYGSFGGAGIGGSNEAIATNITITGGNIRAGIINDNSYRGDAVGSGDDGGTSSVFIAPAIRTTISARVGNSNNALQKQEFTERTDVSTLVKGHRIFEADSAVIPCLHNGETEIRGAVEPTYESEGYTGDTYCLECEEKIADGKVIPALIKPSDNLADDLGNTNNLPQTGDNSHIALWLALLMLAGTATLILNRKTA